MLKKIISLVLAVLVALLCFGGCKSTNSLEGAHVFMFKCTGNSYGNTMNTGFQEVMKKAGVKSAFKAPSESTVTDQVKMIDTLITQKVASITISAVGDTGYNEVFKRAKEAGITVVSADSATAPDNRTVHIDPCYPKDIGISLVEVSVLIALGVEYPENEDTSKVMEDALKNYNGKEIKFGVLSAASDTVMQNMWIDAMRTELKRDIYKGKVSEDFEVKYGNDDPTLCTSHSIAFNAENKIDVLIAPDTIAMAAAGQVLTSSKSKIKLTGLGLPSEMQSFMPKSPTDNAFDYVCPYMLLWNVKDFGAVAAAATLAACDGKYDGKVGSTFTYNGKTYTTTKADDGGTNVISLEPYVFYKGNMADWKDKL